MPIGFSWSRHHADLALPLFGTITKDVDIQWVYDIVWHAGLVQKLSSLAVASDLIHRIVGYLSFRISHTLVCSPDVIGYLTIGVLQSAALRSIVI